jgi:hypothetical protein
MPTKEASWVYGNAIVAEALAPDLVQVTSRGANTEIVGDRRTILQRGAREP